MKNVLLSTVGINQAFKATAIIFAVVTIVSCAITIIRVAPLSSALISLSIKYFLIP